MDYVSAIVCTKDKLNFGRQIWKPQLEGRGLTAAPSKVVLIAAEEVIVMQNGLLPSLLPLPLSY